MNCHRKISIFLIFALVLFVTLVSGCVIPGTDTKDTGNSTALDIALKHPDIASEIKTSNNDYRAEAIPSNSSLKGYLNYSGNFYDVIIDTDNLGFGYIGQFKTLVDVDRGQVMMIKYSYDVASMPARIQLPAYATWYQRMNSPRVALSSMPTTYVEMKLDQLDDTIRPMIMDDVNFALLKEGKSYDSLKFSDLGENATQVNFDKHIPQIATCLENVTVVPGRLPFPGNNVNGSAIGLTYDDIWRQYYFVIVNAGPTDVTVQATVM
ncbi:MAG TPA: hypothetical protein VGJ92_06615 [Methanocella sp.]